MSSSPLTIAREAKEIHQALKDLLKSKDPFDREIDFQRKNLRRRYLSLLLVHPYTKESKDAETHLWMQTSYAFIAVYKQRIAALDRAQNNQQRQQQQQNQQSRGNDHGPVEYRKLLQRFRQFLADEEKFWTQLVIRFSRSFTLDEAQQHLVDLGILTTSTDGKVIDEADDTANSGRNHYQFPPLDASSNGAPSSQAERESRLAILSKALICLGDLARYREQYNEAGGRPRAGHEDQPTRRGRNRRGGSFSLDGGFRPRNYDRARQCYEHAQQLVPQEGNPSHQLAILASYQKDPFYSLVHYHRALCVRQPYETASENMGTVMSKTLDQWKKKDAASRDPPENAVPKIRIDALKEKTVVLHALWRMGLEKMDSLSRKLTKAVHADFHSLISKRDLPEDLISDFVVLSQSALFKQRMLGDQLNTSKSKGKKDGPPPAILPASVIEARITSHILRVHCILLQVGRSELDEPLPPDVPESDLAQRITAVFRRTLPALRIASKWLRANFDLVMTFSEAATSHGTRRNKGDNDFLIMPEFWTTYTDFIRTLRRSFPFSRLPGLAGKLDEDVHMKGFLPLKDMLEEREEAGLDNDSAEKLASAESQGHPNVLQLMRIRDLLNDADGLVQVKDSPLALYGNHIIVKGTELELTTSQHDAGQLAKDASEDDPGTDDELVRAAFGFLDGEEDEVVYMRAEPVSPTLSVSPHKSPVLHVAASPPASHRSPVKPPVSATTAQDLLNDVMGLGTQRGINDINRRPVLPTSSPGAFMFNADSNVPGQTIWSAAQDEQPLKFSSTSAQVPVHTPYRPAMPDIQHSPWAHQSNLAFMERAPPPHPGPLLPPGGSVGPFAVGLPLHPNGPTHPFPIGTKDPFAYHSSLSPHLASAMAQPQPPYMNSPWDQPDPPFQNIPHVPPMYQGPHMVLHDPQAMSQTVASPHVWGAGG